MKVRIGDYIVDKFGITIHVTDKIMERIINVNNMAVRLATEKEIQEYQKGRR